MSPVKELKTPARKCTIPKCEATKISARGLCVDCYLAARYQIKSGKTTWEQLESLGLVAPKRRVKRNAFYDAFDAATQRALKR